MIASSRQRPGNTEHAARKCALRVLHIRTRCPTAVPHTLACAPAAGQKGGKPQTKTEPVESFFRWFTEVPDVSDHTVGEAGEAVGVRAQGVLQPVGRGRGCSARHPCRRTAPTRMNTPTPTHTYSLTHTHTLTHPHPATALQCSASAPPCPIMPLPHTHIAICSAPRRSPRMARMRTSPPRRWRPWRTTCKTTLRSQK